MTVYDAECPSCGYKNKDMYLDETDGWMECEKCGKLYQFPQFRRFHRIPVYNMDQLPDIMKGCQIKPAGTVAVR